ncbi:type II secretion system F family protein [Streptomyces pinistramenti]|uniref:type II secretion system F family protein n=1 Tax=Streptomyces pinistramenti TaxID=2884812 RepID=UPI002222DA4E
MWSVWGPEGGSVATGVAVFCAGAAGWLAGGGRDDSGRRAREMFAGGADPVAAAVAARRVAWWRGGLGAGLRGRFAGVVTVVEGADGASGRRWRIGPRLSVGREVWCLPAGLVIGVLGGSVLPVLASMAAVFVVRRWLRARGAERARDRRAAEVIGLCAAAAGELRAGRQPAQALLAAGASGLGEAGSAVMAAARYGGDVPRALRAAARLPGAGGLGGVAACWQVAVEGGAGLASGLERIAAGLRAQRDQREEVRAQLAGPRATALMLSLLPVCGFLMGSALGADPLRVLLHTPVGWVCLVSGGLLEWAGVAWTSRIVADALPPVSAGRAEPERKGRRADETWTWSGGEVSRA